jgi:hypothetical protein
MLNLAQHVSEIIKFFLGSYPIPARKAVLELARKIFMIRKKRSSLHKIALSPQRLSSVIKGVQK